MNDQTSTDNPNPLNGEHWRNWAQTHKSTLDYVKTNDMIRGKKKKKENETVENGRI